MHYYKNVNGNASQRREEEVNWNVETLFNTIPKNEVCVLADLVKQFL